MFKNQLLTFYLLSIVLIIIHLAGCKKEEIKGGNTTDQISIDSLKASLYTVEAWDTTTITCYARGDSITYSWECDHGNFNGGGLQIRYAAGQCCVGLNTITCTVSNKEGIVSDTVKINVTRYIDD
jgi:hypothetical protein